jgi:prepilin-type N-terminal cleavage/methylation domain-containing protein/prepilin-type processing-associated H-X9-DG protein
MRKSRRAQRYLHVRPSGFTLIEVLVVVAIIALLVAILLPSLAAAKRQARIVVCAGNLHVISQGLVFYAQASMDDMPAGYAINDDGTLKYSDTDKAQTMYDLNTFEFLYAAIQKASPKKAALVDGSKTGWTIRLPAYSCPDDRMQHESSQRPMKMPDGTMANVQFSLSYGANLSVMAADLTDMDDRKYVKGAAKLSKIGSPSQITSHYDNGDDGNRKQFQGGWVLSDGMADHGMGQCTFEVHHKTGNNFLFLDSHVSFHNLNYKAPTYGLPPWPAAFVPNWKGKGLWTGPAYVWNFTGFPAFQRPPSAEPAELPVE